MGVLELLFFGLKGMVYAIMVSMFNIAVLDGVHLVRMLLREDLTVVNRLHRCVVMLYHCKLING